jgi:hypothetical protein
MNQAKDEQNNRNNIPDNDPSKGMNSRKEVENSNDEKIDQDFPGYPHYPAKEDMMDQRTDTHRVDLDVENIPSNRNVTGMNQRFKAEQQSSNEPETALPDSAETDDLSTTDSRKDEIGAPHNVTKEDLPANDQNKEPGRR